MSAMNVCEAKGDCDLLQIGKIAKGDKSSGQRKKERAQSEAEQRRSRSEREAAMSFVVLFFVLVEVRILCAERLTASFDQQVIAGRSGLQEEFGFVLLVVRLKQEKEDTNRTEMNRVRRWKKNAH